MNRTAYSDTDVTVDRSQARIRSLLAKYGAERMQVTEDFAHGKIVIAFMHRGHQITLPLSTDRYVEAILKAEPWSRRRSATREAYVAKIRERAARGIWRAAEFWLKSTFEAIEFGVVTFEEAFMAHYGWQLPDGTIRRLGDYIIPQLEAPNGQRKLEQLLLEAPR